MAKDDNDDKKNHNDKKNENDKGSDSASNKSKSSKNSESDDEKDDKDEEKKEKKKMWCCGIVFQIIAIIANMMLWGLAVYSTAYGIVIGLSTNTIGVEDYDILDWVILTPATLFLYYGIPMLVVATWGWFATVSAHPVNIIIYLILIVLFILYDIIFAICILFCANAYKEKFTDYLQASIERWGGDDDAEHIGIIITIHPTTYWDHLQDRGKCCGFQEYDDWKNNSIATENASIPDSCCNENFGYKGCGFLAWKHPDHEQHTMESILNDRGCLTIFPDVVQNDDDAFFWGLGFLLLIILIIAIVASIALLVLVICCGYKRPTGLNNPDFTYVPINPSLLSTRSSRSQKVHPDNSQDRSTIDDDESRHRKISFEEKPSYISEDERSRDQRSRDQQRGDESPRYNQSRRD